MRFMYECSGWLNERTDTKFVVNDSQHYKIQLPNAQCE